MQSRGISKVTRFILWAHDWTDVTKSGKIKLELAPLPETTGGKDGYFFLINWMYGIFIDGADNTVWLPSININCVFSNWRTETKRPTFSYGVMRLWWDGLSTVWCLKPRWQLFPSIACFLRGEEKERAQRKKKQEGTSLVSECGETVTQKKISQHVTTKRLNHLVI